MSSAPVRLANSVTNGPATTNVSLLAMATRLPASTAAQVLRNPAAPTMAATTISTSGSAAIRSIESAPKSSSVLGEKSLVETVSRRDSSPKTAQRGSNRRLCSASNSTGDTDHAELIPMSRYHIESACPDGTGRTQDRDPLHPRCFLPKRVRVVAHIRIITRFGHSRCRWTSSQGALPEFGDGVDRVQTTA
jgi:hypothetical protein